MDTPKEKESSAIDSQKRAHVAGMTQRDECDAAVASAAAAAGDGSVLLKSAFMLTLFAPGSGSIASNAMAIAAGAWVSWPSSPPTAHAM